MYCYKCQLVKAEAGCYLPNAEKRVCLDCFRNVSGKVPFPMNTPSSLGGAFANGQKVFAHKKSAGDESVSQKMKQVGKAVVAGAAGLREWRDEKKQEFREAKEAFWREMPAPVQEYRNKLAEKIIDPALGKVKETSDEIVNQAEKLLGDLF